MIQMHTIHESNCTVIKLPLNGDVRRKKFKKYNSVYGSYQVQGAVSGMEALNHFYTDHTFVD